jgi:hypothetical protein
MKILTSLNQVNQLPHSKAVRSALLYELIAPFGSTEKTNTFWNEYPTELLALLPNEDVDAFLQGSADAVELFKCAEFVTHLYDTWHLALVITSQEGAGCYLLFPYGVNSTLDNLLPSSYNNE